MQLVPVELQWCTKAFATPDMHPHQDAAMLVYQIHVLVSITEHCVATV